MSEDVVENLLEKWSRKAFPSELWRNRDSTESRHTMPPIQSDLSMSDKV